MNRYSSDDDGAVPLTGLDHALVDVLASILLVEGWTQPYDTAGAGVFLQGGAANQRYLRVKDDHRSGDVDYARLTGYETMSAIGTGTNPFPSAVDTTLFHKASKPSSGGNITDEIPWVAYIDARTIIFFNRPHLKDAAAQLRWNGWYFGDYFALDPDDLFNQVLMVGPSPGPLVLLSSQINSSGGMAEGGNDASSLIRPYAGGSSLTTGCGFTTGSGAGVAYSGDAAKQPAADDYTKGLLLGPPNPADGRTYTAPLFLAEATTGQTRGFLRGMRHYCHLYASATDQQAVPGTDENEGRSFILFKEWGDNNGDAVPALACVEDSDTWDTNE